MASSTTISSAHMSCIREASVNHAEVLGYWFLDPRHPGQLGTGRHWLRDSENLYFEDYVADSCHSNGL